MGSISQFSASRVALACCEIRCRRYGSCQPCLARPYKSSGHRDRGVGTSRRGNTSSPSHNLLATFPRPDRRDLVYTELLLQSANFRLADRRAYGQLICDERRDQGASALGNTSSFILTPDAVAQFGANGGQHRRPGLAGDQVRKRVGNGDSRTGGSVSGSERLAGVLGKPLRKDALLGPRRQQRQAAQPVGHPPQNAPGRERVAVERPAPSRPASRDSRVDGGTRTDSNFALERNENRVPFKAVCRRVSRLKGTEAAEGGHDVRIGLPWVRLRDDGHILNVRCNGLLS